MDNGRDSLIRAQFWFSWSQKVDDNLERISGESGERSRIAKQGSFWAIRIAFSFLTKPSLLEPMGHPVFFQLCLLDLPFSTGRVKLQTWRVGEKFSPKHGAFSPVDFEKTRPGSVPDLSFPFSCDRHCDVIRDDISLTKCEGSLLCQKRHMSMRSLDSCYISNRVDPLEPGGQG